MAMMSVSSRGSGPFQTVEDPTISQLPLLLSTIITHCCLSRSSLRRTSNWIRDALLYIMPPSKSFNVLMRLGQSICMLIGCMPSLQLGKDGGHVMSWRAGGQREWSACKGYCGKELFEICRRGVLGPRYHVGCFLGGPPEHRWDNQRICWSVMYVFSAGKPVDGVRLRRWTPLGSKGAVISLLMTISRWWSHFRFTAALLLCRMHRGRKGLSTNLALI